MIDNKSLRNDLISMIFHVSLYLTIVQRDSAETIPTHHQSTTMHWFAMCGEDETMIDLLDLGTVLWVVRCLCCPDVDAIFFIVCAF